MAPALCTTWGNGPFVPTVVYNGTAYPVGRPMADMGEALREAIAVLERIRDGMRHEDYDAILERLD